ncbi:ABC transporter ATP-binding protein [Mariniblastus fucicola]|uniref:Putative ABC transporter ATP-binding protein YxlF n=1 Tax=Mariniblastus fucicola TaxID=980251 RepID=A0A5B9PIZ4_9BACT|nr:ABC transporter ATP-binding protein [Mariniblastus fucicola]QEG25220.1 putative ABC transporter ATP-binding protein YxlF [Mariniblastus fucicola]
MTATAEAELVTANTADSGPPAIVSDKLFKTYSEGIFSRKKFQALKGVSFQVNQGEIFGLLGPNGAGKTTFIKVLLGIIRKSGGSASMMGYPAGSKNCREMVGYLPERLRIPPHLTAYNALEYFGNLSNVPTSVVKAKRDEYLELVGLKGRETDLVKKFSKGMVQRLGLAQALLHDPKMVILDEPTDGLDPRARAEMRAIIKNLANRGVTIFLNSHLLQEVEMICNRVAILDKGNLRYCGPVANIGEFLGAGSVGADGKPVATIKSYLFNLIGTPQTLQSGLEGCEFTIVSNVEGMAAVKVAFQDQSDVDRIVDKLRSSGVSIAGMELQRVSLEDAFLQLID